jgi:uncharacterized membrane protein YeaQ/YmgE (transglycosylase-associated protein family)
VRATVAVREAFCRHRQSRLGVCYGYPLDHHHRVPRRRHRQVPHAGPAGFILTTILGIVGAFVATFLGQAIGWYGPNQGAGFIGAIVGAVVVLFIYGLIAGRRTTTY